MRNTMFFCLLLTAASIFCQERAVFSICVINYDEVTNAYMSAKNIDADFMSANRATEQELEELKNRLAGLRENVKNEYDELTKQEIQNDIADLQEYIRLRTELFGRTKHKRARDFMENDDRYAALSKLIVNYTKGAGYDLIFDSGSENVLWWSPDLDLTDEIIQAIRK